MRLSIALLAFFSCFDTLAQSSFFAQHTYAIPESVPARIGIDSYASASMLYKNQKLAGADNFVSSLIFAKYPIVNHKNNRLALGISLLKNQIKGPGNLTEQLFSSTIAYSFNYKKNAGVSFAMDVGMVSKKIDLNDIQTGAMWTIEDGFNPSLGSGENLSAERLVYPKLNASFYWFENDRNKDTKSYLGLSVFQLNKYKDSFYTADKLTSNKQFTLLGGVRVYDKNQIALIPKFIITSTTKRSYVKLGMDFNYSLSKFSRLSRKENSFNMEVNYQLNKGAQFGIQYLQPKYVVGMAYHIDMSANVEAGVFNNAVEVLLIVRNPINTTPQKNKRRRNKKRKTKKKKKATPPTKRNKPPSEKVIPPVIKLELDSTKVTVVDSTQIPSSQIPKEKEVSNYSEIDVNLGSENSFHFEYNSAKINEASYQKLEEIAELLKSYPNSKVILVGHTDNIGSAERNFTFSLTRAKAAAKVLLKQGVSPSQIITQGKGELEPTDTNDTEKGRSINRRIEFYIINQ